MKDFNHFDFKNLPHNRILKIKLKTKVEWLNVKYVSKPVLQSFQPDFTPKTRYHLEVIKDIELYSRDVEDDDNYYLLTAELEDIIMWKVEKFHFLSVVFPSGNTMGFTQLLHYVQEALNKGDYVLPFLCVIDTKKAVVMKTSVVIQF
jgi:hypothetical protein